MAIRSSHLTAALAALAAFAPAQSIPTLAGIEAHMEWAANNFSSICQKVDLNATYGTPLTWEGRSLNALKISDNVAQEEDEEAFLLVAAHHGNEIGTPVVALDAITRLITGYGVDPAITEAVDTHEIWIIPVCNPDGYPNSRHNSRAGGGVDLNRNYPFLWGSSCNYGVKGPSPASEPEVQTIMALSEDVRFTKVIDFHSSGRETLWGYRPECLQHYLGQWLFAEAIQISMRSGYGGANRGPSSNGEHYHWQLGNYSNYAFLTEISNTQSPTLASAQAEAAMLWPATLWMMQRPVPVWGHVTDAVTGAPIEANISYLEYPFTNGERNRSEPRYGRYHVFLPNGQVTLRFQHPCYVTQDLPVDITGAGQQIEVELAPVCAECATRNGSGVNQIGYVCTTPPVLGASWDSDIAVTQFTASTHLGIGAGPAQVPLLGGELLIDLTSSVFVPGLGSYSIPIPNEGVFLGLPLYTQGFRIDVIGGNPTLVLLNAQDAVAGMPTSN